MAPKAGKAKPKAKGDKKKKEEKGAANYIRVQSIIGSFYRVKEWYSE